jgi:hypothetical protein
LPALNGLVASETSAFAAGLQGASEILEPGFQKFEELVLSADTSLQFAKIEKCCRARTRLQLQSL